jgi:D-serine deaminase-like pyridoxal phosphate-dependent protein
MNPPINKVRLMFKITKPFLFVNETRVKRNNERITKKAIESHVRFHPHFKTHQSALIGECFRDLGILTITVSSLDMAEYFASHNWNDITVWWQNKEKVEKIAQIIKQADNLLLQGILTHAGQSYQVTSVSDIEQIHRDSILQMKDVKNYLLSNGYLNIKISTGDTPTCSIATDFSGIDEIRPGNMVFYDIQQVRLGS